MGLECAAPNPVCAGLAPRPRPTLSSFGKGEVIFDEGQLLHGVYLLVKGAVSMRVQRHGEVAEVATVGPGEFFGEAGMHGAQAADARAVAAEDAEVLLLRPDTVRQLFEASPILAAIPAECSTSGGGRCTRRELRCWTITITPSASAVKLGQPRQYNPSR